MERFARYTTDDFVCRLGFNHHQRCFGEDSSNQSYSVYLTQWGCDKFNLVVIERTRSHMDNYDRVEFFVGYYRGMRPGECRNHSEAQTVREKIKHMMVRKNRVSGKDLERRMIEVREVWVRERLSD
jgi:hypothetical protein